MNPLMKKKFLDQYQQTSVETGLENATPHKLVSMLYEGALDNIALSKGAMERKDFALKSEKLNKAISILSGLQDGLDLDAGKEVSENLLNLYDYMKRRLIEAGTQQDSAALDEVADLIRGIKEAWDQMPSNIKSASHEQLKKLKTMQS